ncbi:glucose 1-dehydrogenase [Alicyclobacillus sp.]|uniref:SDR family NAD(P)-dependent oxidoreductase n=1 Tax=Alicyclobacillus sp. TaxID=61169 RepID=UPI0025C3D22B|nr:glucose 1-dehydrogenase [Alicyclobacillus sp.]MCL6516328.1 glucose 1-dehydrogenase [Alicyclobacillus sp.]
MNELMVGRLFDWTDKNVIITGAGGSIGSTLAHAFATYQANVVLVDKNAESLTNLHRMIEEMGRTCLTFAVDVTDVEAIHGMVHEVQERLGSIDVLINHAGMNIRKQALDLELAEWDRVLSVNLRGMFAVAQAVGRVMVAQRAGKIVNTASVSAVRGHKHLVAYAASKGGVQQMTKVLAHEWAPYGVNVNAVGPGYIYTHQTEDLLADPAARQSIAAKIPMGRIGEPADLVGAYLFLASPAANYITGQTLFVDGGRTVD